METKDRKIQVRGEKLKYCMREKEKEWRERGTKEEKREREKEKGRKGEDKVGKE